MSLLNRCDCGYCTDECGRITEFEERQGQRQEKCQYAGYFIQNGMNKNNPFMFFKPIQNIYALDHCDNRNPYIQPYFNVQDRNQLYKANRHKDDICN